MTEQHPTVGWRFRAHGSIYLCTRWVRSSGFDMRLLEKGEHDDRSVGDVANVSERAIGRTFHLVSYDGECAAHEQPCNCYLCEGRGPA